MVLGPDSAGVGPAHFFLVRARAGAHIPSTPKSFWLGTLLHVPLVSFDSAPVTHTLFAKSSQVKCYIDKVANIRHLRPCQRFVRIVQI